MQGLHDVMRERVKINELSRVTTRYQYPCMLR